jgi:predicted AlkP superfamily phosphohydrolase/phosphomutase
MFFHSLNIMRKGTQVCVFDTSDRVQHMFWRYHEKEHPANRVSPPTLNFDPIADMYLKMDDLLGRTLKCIGQDDVLLVISDHGFASFRRCFNLNAYLRENGYLQLKAGCEGGDYFKNVDWSKTKAFAVGLGGLFINLKGREKSGSVAPGSEYENLKAELKARLTGLKDPLTGEIAINSIYSLEQFGDGPYRLSGPDLLLGFNPGYRIAWDSATGNPAGEVFSDNIKKWSGDHCIDYKQVPGIFFATKAINHPDPELKDIAPTIIDLFSLKPPDYMEGRPLMQEHPDSVRAKH